MPSKAVPKKSAKAKQLRLDRAENSTKHPAVNSPKPDSLPTKNSDDLPVDKPDALPFGESPLKKNISRGTVVKFVLFGLLILALLIYLGWDVITKGPLMQLLMNRERLVELVRGCGFWGPLLYVALQIVQVVVAPIPGQIVGGVGGFLFGHWGILWTTIGSLVGFWLVFLIARRFGRPLIEKIFKKAVIDKFDFIINAKGAALVIFAIFMLPGFPDDLICYLAGLTKLSMKKLMLIAILGRFPTIVLTNYVGMGLNDNLGLVAGLSVIAVFIFAIVAWKREQIIAFLKRDGKGASDKSKSLRNDKGSDDKPEPSRDGKSDKTSAEK